MPRFMLEMPSTSSENSCVDVREKNVNVMISLIKQCFQFKCNLNDF